ncbi:MAG: FHA domain-containing protein [Verrucomicrobiota bacterium]
MSKKNEIGSSVFPFAEILQHYGQTGRTGLFTVKNADEQATVYLMSGIVAHAESPQLSGETAMWDILSWQNPEYDWQDAITPNRMTMSGTVQDLVLKSIQIASSGELERIKENAGELHKTRTIIDADQNYLIMLKVSSVELPPFEFQVTSKQLRVGRHPDNDMVLPDTSISRKHALCIINQDTILIRDLGSMNGIKINGEPMIQGLARDGQIITIGEVNCEVHISLVKKTPSISKTATSKVFPVKE